MEMKTSITEQKLLDIAGCLTHIQAEKLAILLKIDRSEVSSLRRAYADDAELFAYQLLLKWWNACELSDFDAENEIREALIAGHLAGIARTFIGLKDDEEQVLSEQYIMSIVENLNHTQVEHLAIKLGIRINVLESLRKIYLEDAQLFGFHVVVQWKDNSILSPDKQKELLASIIESVHKTSYQSYDSDDDIEVDSVTRINRINRFTAARKKMCTKLCCCSSICFLYIVLILLTSISFPILLTIPSLTNQSIIIQPGDTVKVPLSNWAVAVNIQLSSPNALCKGKAMALSCSSIKPYFKWKNISQTSFIFMAEGSMFQIFPKSSNKGSYYYIWIFSDFNTFSKYSSINYQGIDCAKPGKGIWCYDFSGYDNNEPVNYTVPVTSYYFISCSGDTQDADLCFFIKNWYIYQGRYYFSNYSGSHSYIHTSQLSTQLAYRNRFNFSSDDICLLSYVSNNVLTSCYIQRASLILSNQQRRYGLLLFPALLLLLILLCFLIYSFIFCYELHKSRTRSSFRRLMYYELTNRVS